MKQTPYAGLYFKVRDLSPDQMLVLNESIKVMIPMDRIISDYIELLKFVQKEFKMRGYFGIRAAPDGTPYIIEYAYDRKNFEDGVPDGTPKGPQCVSDWFE